MIPLMRTAMLFAVVSFLEFALHAASSKAPYYGRPADIQRQVDMMSIRGLEFLRKHQQPAGNFTGAQSDSYGSRPAVVGLAVLAFLAYEDDPKAGVYAGNIKRGLDFILKQQNRRTGYIGSSMYSHGFATLALAKAHGVVPDPKKNVGKALELAVQCILRAQSIKKGGQQGGWRYSPTSSDSDTCVTGANLPALIAARKAGLMVPDEPIHDALRYIRRCQSADGGIGYRTAGSSNVQRSAIGALMFCLAKKKEDRSYKKIMDYLKSKPADGVASHYYHYYLYYTSQVYCNGDFKDWKKWDTRNVQALKESVQTDGGWQSNLGPTFATTTSLLSMAPGLVLAKAPFRFEADVRRALNEADVRRALNKPTGEITKADLANHGLLFSKRLQKLADSSEAIQGKLKLQIVKLLGVQMKDLPPETRKELGGIAMEAERDANQVLELWFEIRRYASASERLEFRQVADEMSQTKVLYKLQNTPSLIKKNNSLVAIKNFGETAQQFRAWAARLGEQK